MVSSNMQEDDKQFSGNELDGMEDEEGKPSAEEEDDLKDAKKEQAERRRILSPTALVALSMLTLFILTGIGFLYLKKAKPDVVSGQNEIKKREVIPSINRIAISKDQLFVFDSFIIPITEKKGFTYFSLSICFNMPNKELKEEIIENEAALRGIIFDRLRQEMSKTEEIPTIGTLKKFISGELNKSLSNGMIKEVYITKFLAV
jgi:flagellar basal body-associated protein FliL